MFVFLFSLMGDGVSYAGIISNCSNCGGEGKAVNYGRSINIPEKARPNDATISSYQIRRNNWLLRKSNQGFLDLQVQLEGTENRITKARTDYNETVKSYNKRVKVFPGKLWASLFGFEGKNYFESTAEAATAPSVSFE